MAGTQSSPVVNVLIPKEGEADDVSFVRTEDDVCLLCSSGDGSRKGYLAADGFGSEFCYLEPDTRGEEPSELWKCTFKLEEALSVHALSTYKPKKKQQVQRKILMYGQAVLLRHQKTKKLLRCLASSPANDKLSHHIGFSERPGMVDGSCWFLVCPSTKQRSDGEKVQADDNILLRSVSNERFLSAHHQSGESDSVKHSNMVLASFQLSVWVLQTVCSGSAREAASGYVNGTDVIHLLHCHGAGDSLSVAARSCDKSVNTEKSYSEVCYQCPVKVPLRTLWRVELFQMKFRGGFTEWKQPFRLRHVVTGKFLGVRSVCRTNCGGGGGKEGTGEEGREKNRETRAGVDDKHIAVLLEPSEATFKTSAFCFTDATSPAPSVSTVAGTSSLSAKSSVVGREAMGQPQVKFGDSEVLLVHVDSGRLVGCPVTQHSRHLLGRRERRRVVVQRERHQAQGFTVTRGSEEQAKAASIIQLMETCMRSYVKKVICSTCSESEYLSRTLLNLLDDLIHYFHLPPPPLTSLPPLSHTSHPPKPPSSSSTSSPTHDSWQAELCLLRERQELFQKQGLLLFTLNVITETGQKCRTRCSQVAIQIHHRLYELLAAIIRGNRKNCSEFATCKWLKVFIDQLNMPLFTHDVLEVIQCLLADSPEVLNIITKEHIQVIVNLLLSRGRDDVVMKLLSSLCVCSDVAMRDKQRLIYQHLVDCRDLLIQTSLHDYIHCLHPGLYIGANEGGNSHQKWYYEARVTQVPAQSPNKPFHLRVGWAHPTLFQPRPSSNSILTTSGGVGDDLYSVSFDGEFIWFGGHPIKSSEEPLSSTHRKRVLQRQFSLSSSPVPPPLAGDQQSESTGRTWGAVCEGDVIGCYCDLGRREVWFSKNGATVPGALRLAHLDDLLTPAISMSNNVSMVLSYGGSMGEFSHPPHSDYTGLCEAALPSSTTDELTLHPFITLGNSGDLSVAGPEIHASHEGFVPAPIDTGGLSLPGSLLGIRERLATQLHEVWAKNKIEAGYTFAEERNDALKQHPMLCPLSSLPLEDSQYNHSMAYQTLTTLLVLGYQIVSPDSRSSHRLQYLTLDEEMYRQSNGYFPRPLDLHSVTLDEGLEGLVTRLAENCHNVWAATRIKQGWTYGRSTDAKSKKNPCLVPYDKLDPATKKSNWDSACDTVQTVVALGCTIVPPSSLPTLSNLTREYSESEVKIKNFRGQTCYAVTSGKWYYEVKLLTDGMMRVGWATPSFQPHLPLGNDEHSYAFDGYLACKWHSGRESFGQRWSAGDVVGCLLDMDAGQVAFTLNRDLLQDSLGSTVAFEGVRGVGLVPVVTMAAGQRAQLNFGRSKDALRSNFSSMGYKPLCSPSALHYNVPLWYSWPHESLEPLSPSHPRLLVARRSSDLTPKCSSQSAVLSVTCRDWDYSQGAETECLRLSSGVLITPETAPLPATTPQSVHPRPGPFSPTPTATANGWVPFTDCLTPRRNVVSYTAVVPAGQDPRIVYVGWTTAQFRYISSEFCSEGWSRGGCEGVYGQRVECVGRCEGVESASPSNNTMEYSQSSAYLVCVKQLLSSFHDQNLPESVRVVCTLDTLTGALTFSTTLPAKKTPNTSSSHKKTLSVQTHCKLFPTVITTPSTDKVIDLDFTPDLCCKSIASTLVPPSSGAKLPPCPHRFRLMVLSPSQWVRQPFHKVPFTTSLPPEGGMKVESHREPSYSVCATLPEEDQVMDLLELSENEQLINFHMSTLKAYSAVSSNCNEAITKKVAAILDPEQLLRCLKLRGMHYSLRATYTQLFNTLHLDPEVHTKLVTRSEFILPLTACETSVPLFLSATQHKPTSPTTCGVGWETAEVDQALSNQARVTHNIKSCLPCGVSDGTCRLIFSVRQLKEMVFYDLEKLLSVRYHKGTLLPRQSCSEVIVPLLTLLDNLLVAGALRDERDLGKLLSLLDPHTFALKCTPYSEGLLSLQVAVEEPIKLALCSLLHHLCDCQVQHRVESTIAFATSYVDSLQRDQRERYERTFAKKPKEFRSPPKKQMEGMLSFQRSGVYYSECPTPSELRQALNEFHSDLKRHCGASNNTTHSPDNMADKTLREKLKGLAVLIHKALFSSDTSRDGRERGVVEGGGGLQRMVMSTMIQWAQVPIHSPELIQQIFSLLYRQCDEINEVVQALQKTYVIDVTEVGSGGKMNFNLPEFRRALGCLRLLLKVGMGREEEHSLKNSLRTISHSGLFYCHPQLLRSLGVHLTVLGLMRSYLGINVAGLEDDSFLTARRKMKMALSKEGLPAPVEWCCKFLCSFARVSSDNQRALFSHISYLLEYSEKNAGCMTCRGCTPLDVATATIRDNAELCLALDDAHLHHVVSLLVSTTTSLALGGGSFEQGGGEEGREGSVGSVACDWAPNGGEKCLNFLQCAVWADGEQIQENAYAVVRLLIHHPECLGPALTGEAIGLHQVYEDVLEHMMDTPQYGSSRASPRDYSDLGSAYPLRGSPSLSESASDSPPHSTLQLRSSSTYLNLNLMNTQLVLSFYTSLVRLLAYCAPVDDDTSTTLASGTNTGATNCTTSDKSDTTSDINRSCGVVDVKKSGAERTRNILRNLISVGDVRGILSLPYPADGQQGIVPAHKEAALLFLTRVYGVTEAQLFRELLTDAFLPDIKTALKLSASQEESPLSSCLLRYLTSSVFPLLTSCTVMLPQLYAHLHIIINLLMCCCRLGTTCQLTARQLTSVTTFLTEAYRCLHPAAIQRLLPKVIADIPSMQPHTIMYTELLGSHYSHYARYYVSGQRSLGRASEEEKMLSAVVVYRLLDTLASSLPPERLERSCGACLQAVSCAIAPDTLLPSQCQLGSMYTSSAMGYDPRPACIERVTVLKPEVKQFVQDYANVLHDTWIFEQQALGWTYGAEYREETHEHPHLKPLNILSPKVKEEYTQPIEEAIKYLIVRGWCLSKVRTADFSGVPTRQKTICLRRRKKKDGTEEIPYEPDVLDLSKVSTPVEMLAKAEMIAEEAHDRWASQLKNTSEDYQSHPFYHPYELVDDVVKEERRSYALDLLRYLRLCGFELLRTGKMVASLAHSRQSSLCQERFSLQLFDKFLRLLSENRDPVYYSRVLFPMLASYLDHNRKYFIPLAGQRSANSASREERFIILRLFCQVMDYAHTHKFHIFSSIHKQSSKSLSTLGRRSFIDRAQPPPSTTDPSTSEEKGSLFREIQHLIESIVRSLDVKAIAVGSSSLADQCPDILTFFRQALETVTSAKREISQKKQLKNSHIQSYTLSLLIPALTVLFNHVGHRDTSRLLVQGQVLAHCRLVFQTLVEMATGVTPIFVGTSPIVAIGRCLGAFSRAYPDPFLEKRLFGFDLESLLSQLDVASMPGSTAGNVLYVVDIVIPVLSNYIAKWYSGNSLDSAHQEKVDYTLSQILALVTTHFTAKITGCCWFIRIIDSSLALAQKCSSKLLSTHLLPMCQRLRERAVALWQTEQLITSHIASSSASSGVENYTEELVEDYKLLARDLSTTLLFLVVFLKSHSEELRGAGRREEGGSDWRKSVLVREDVSRDVNALFVAMADVFHCWFSSPHLRRVFLIGTQWLAQNPILKSCFSNLYPQRENQSHSNCNLITNSLEILLPIMDQFMSRGDRDQVDRCTEKLSEKGACLVAMKTELIDLLQMQEQTEYHEHFGHKLVKSISRTFIVPQSSCGSEERAECIVGLARVRHRMKLVENPEGEGARSKWKQLFTRRKRKAVLACFLAVPFFAISKHRAINLFLEVYSQEWLGTSKEHTSSALCHELVDHQDYLVTHKSSSLAPHHRDPLTQLFTMMKRRAATGECLDHDLFIAYPKVLSKIITGVGNDDKTTSEENVSVAYQSYHKRRAELYARQNQLARRGAASTVLLVITAAKGTDSEAIHSILKLGIALLEEGNHLVQGEMLAQLQAMDVGFLSSVACLVSNCSVLDWNAYQRYQRSEVMQSTSCLAISKVLCGSEVTEDLFRFLQLLCEGHNADFQNYLRTQAGNTTTVNIITCTVDYLLRLQESISDFYWHYSGQETIDLLGRDSLLRAFRVAKQVFRALTEYIQGPCVQNQETLARSRLLDAVSGFLQVFAVLQRKLYKDTSQVELLRELLGLQEEMFILLLGMLEGSAMSSQLGRLMVDMLVESEQWVQDIMAFFSIFIKLKDATTSKAFKEYDLNKDGLISYREFEMAMGSQQRYTKEEIAYLMECADTNNDGLLDYMEFTERFHQPAENIGFHLCVLIVHLSEHLPREKRLLQFKTSSQGRELMEHFEQGMGSIEIQGKSGRIERVYFEVREFQLAQWNETQIKESRKNFLHTVDMGSHKKKLERFVSFCEDTIFEMDYADKISGSEQQSRENRAFQHRLRHTKALQSPTSLRTRPILVRVAESARGLWIRYRPLQRLKTVLLALWTLFVIILLTPLLDLLKRAGSKLYTALSRRLTVANYSHQSPGHTSTSSHETVPSSSRGSRLGVLAQRKALRLSIPVPSTTGQSPPAPVQQQPPANTSSSQSQSATGQNGSHTQAGEHRTVSAGRATLSERLKSLLPHQMQTPKTNNTPLISATLHQLNLRYNRSHMRHPSPSPTSPLPTQEGGDGSLPTGMAQDTYVPQITLSTRSWQAFIARHYYRLNNVKLLVTFLINVVLLSFTVHSLSQERLERSDGGTCDANSSVCPPENVELIWNPLYLKLLSALHFLLSLLLILSYWNLKVPLIIFKREKEIARRLETKQMWLGTRQRWSPNLWECSVADLWTWLRDMWDSTVISAPSFPRNYWDKQVKDRVRLQFEGANRDLVTQQLGMATQCPFEARSKWADVVMAINTLGDLRYFVWMVGTVLIDMMVLYHIFYCCLSFLGLRSNSFYFSIHLLDLVMNFKLLRTVLYSVLHNGKQLLMTVLMTCVVIYLYTVIAFNYFRKFYVQQNQATGKAVSTCDSMAKCFIYHIDKGLRAGGGIGDVLKSASGEPDEILRLLFDVTFFFFVIVILLAIIQGLIIDAFGELRDKEDSITADMKNNCFVCGLPKIEFDHVAHGFDNHISRDHNIAYYMFFLQYLIRKQESEFSGQESYVWDMYLKRRWDFFPVGDCFRGQEERRQLSGTEGAPTSSRSKTKRPSSPPLHRQRYSTAS